MKNPNVPPHQRYQANLGPDRMCTSALACALSCALSFFALPAAYAQNLTETSTLELWQPGQQTIPTKQSDPHNEVNKLLRQAKYTQALVLLEKALQKNPRDPQMRFWQAYALERSGNIKMAMSIYLALTQEYPELAEPHNNLGVLYAAQGEYDKARVSLENALRNNPNYATAQENLGDVLVGSAKVAYARAQQMGQKNTSIIKKIDALKSTLQLIEAKP